MMDLETEDDVIERFNHAASFVQSNVRSFDSSQLLLFYGFYKQSTVGCCNTSKPSWYEMEAKEKWNAWNRLGDMSKTDAMTEYVSLLSSLRPEWEASAGASSDNKNKTSWISVSCMAQEDDILDAEEKTAFDWVKEGNIDMVKKSIDLSTINYLDETGMGLIHWAADRGDLNTVQTLVDFSPDLDLVDDSGQTALHYASACGHSDTVKLLLKRGANALVKDSEGQTPADIALTEDIRILITRFT